MTHRGPYPNHHGSSGVSGYYGAPVPSQQLPSLVEPQPQQQAATGVVEVYVVWDVETCPCPRGWRFGDMFRGLMGSLGAQFGGKVVSCKVACHPDTLRDSEETILDQNHCTVYTGPRRRAAESNSSFSPGVRLASWITDVGLEKLKTLLESLRFAPSSTPVPVLVLLTGNIEFGYLLNRLQEAPVRLDTFVLFPAGTSDLSEAFHGLGLNSASFEEFLKCGGTPQNSTPQYLPSFVTSSAGQLSSTTGYTPHGTPSGASVTPQQQSSTVSLYPQVQQGQQTPIFSHNLTPGMTSLGMGTTPGSGAGGFDMSYLGVSLPAGLRHHGGSDSNSNSSSWTNLSTTTATPGMGSAPSHQSVGQLDTVTKFHSAEVTAPPAEISCSVAPVNEDSNEDPHDSVNKTLRSSERLGGSTMPGAGGSGNTSPRHGSLPPTSSWAEVPSRAGGSHHHSRAECPSLLPDIDLPNDDTLPSNLNSHLLMGVVRTLPSHPESTALLHIKVSGTPVPVYFRLSAIVNVFGCPVSIGKFVVLCVEEGSSSGKLFARFVAGVPGSSLPDMRLSMEYISKLSYITGTREWIRMLLKDVFDSEEKYTGFVTKIFRIDQNREAGEASFDIETRMGVPICLRAFFNKSMFQEMDRDDVRMGCEGRRVRAFINHSGLEKSRFDGKTQLGICNLLALENGEFAD